MDQRSRFDAGLLRRRSRTQLGLFTRADARAAGASADLITRRIATGEWVRVMGRVLAPADLVLTAGVRDRASALAVPGGILAGPSAARVHRIEVPDKRLYLAVGRERHPAVPGIRYLRTSVAPIDVTTWAGAPVTTVERTVVDCLVLLPDRPASDLLDRALNRDLLTGNALAEAVRDRVGRRGTKRLLRYLRRIRGGSRSEAERVAIGLLRKAGLSGWTVNSPIEDAAGLVGIGDLVFAAARLVVELDGWAYHMTSQQFQRDRTRQNRLIRAGWTVLRFTWLDLTERPEYVIATIRSVLDRE